MKSLRNEDSTGIDKILPMPQLPGYAAVLLHKIQTTKMSLRKAFKNDGGRKMHVGKKLGQSQQQHIIFCFQMNQQKFHIP